MTKFIPQCFYQTPKFYGIPKIHKKYNTLPPMRPIISQAGSMLTPTARFINHVLQPLAQSYEDYVHNSTSLILRLQDMKILDTASFYRCRKSLPVYSSIRVPQDHIPANARETISHPHRPKLNHPPTTCESSAYYM